MARGKTRSLGVQRDAYFEDVLLRVLLVHALGSAGNLAHCPDIGPVPAPNLAHAAVCKRLDGLAECSTRNPKASHELGFGRYPLLQGPFAGVDHGAQLIGDFLGQGRPMRSGKGHWMLRFLGDWILRRVASARDVSRCPTPTWANATTKRSANGRVQPPVALCSSPIPNGPAVANK